MIINTKIKETFKEIAEQSLKYANTPDQEKKYFKRLMKVFNDDLTEEEQLFVFKMIMEQLHFRNIITDPDNVIQIHNIKMKTITYIFLLTITLTIIIAMIFKVNNGLNSVVDVFVNILKLLAI